jgi:soluble lytic murein transglycosylase
VRGEGTPQNAPQWCPWALTRLASLLALSCLGTGSVLWVGRSLLAQQPTPSPALPSARLEWLRRWSPDPARRREASLLLLARVPGDPQRRAALLRHQGWGSDPVAAVALKQAAQAAAALAQPQRERQLWGDLLRRFPQQPAAADALYYLGRERPALREELLRRFPAHPAALAAALELGPAPAERLRGGLHLARWGARWPGGEERLRQLCLPLAPLAPVGSAAVGGPPSAALPPVVVPTAGQRALLAGGLAQLGDGEAALACLGAEGSAGRATALAALAPEADLALARALLRGEPEQRSRALELLVAAARRGAPAAVAQGGASGGASGTAEEAVRLLAQQQGEGVEGALAALPAAWRASAPVAAWRVLADPQARGALAVLRRWPDDPASWDLQWEVVRRRLLEGRWAEAGRLLEALPAGRLPSPLAARSRFWRGMVQRQLGDAAAARTTWGELRRQAPGGYYGWRAALLLGEPASAASLAIPAAPSSPSPPEPAAEAWQPLASGDGLLDRLWRLDQRTEAWELWRSRRANRPPRQPAELLVEGRLRQGVGDDWLGLAQLEQASLRLPPAQCGLLPQLERSLHPVRFGSLFAAVAARNQLSRELLLGLAKQESRFTPQVRSGAGAVGLMQLMPATAAELAGGPLAAVELEDPARNVALGGLYLRGLLRQWQGNSLLAVASYNAGPGAVEGWIDPRLTAAPELWVEAIPYPETRLYVKKVLGNAWSYRNPELPEC